jgi:choline dehydrogenase-like flavoprotein
MLVKFDADVKLPNFDICVVGAGPVGIALALACEANGLSVLLVESGGLRPNSFSEELSRAKIVCPQHHVPMREATCRAVGGTSLMWGRCCVPYDGVDFTTRLHAGETQWPFAHDEVSQWYTAAAEFFQCGDAAFDSDNSVWPNLQRVASTELARWARERNVVAEHRRKLVRSKTITVLYDATVIALEFADSAPRLEQITVANIDARKRIKLVNCVLACGGCETTRLLLAAQRSRPDILGAPGGPLGRNYMGHMSGTIADLVLNDPRQAWAFDFFRSGGGYARRRFTFPAEVQVAEKLLNIALWVENPALDDATYQNGVLSFIWIVLKVRLIRMVLGVRPATGKGHLEVRGFTASHFVTHLKNVLDSPAHTSRNLAKVVWNRYFRWHRKPTPLVPNRSGRYPLHYMAEQVPNDQSRVWLSEDSDALGLPRLCIDLRFSNADANSVLRAHHLLDAALREAQVGRLEYRVAGEQRRLEQVLAQARDGFHQIGTTRMGRSAESSVVDDNCRVHGVKNLYVASSSVFPSAGQANPTFMAVAMAFRLAHHVGKIVREGRASSAAVAARAR